MDVSEADVDVELQKNSADLIAEIDKFLPRFLHRPDGNGGHKVRSYVPARELNWVTNSCLDPFQELPQLLDPHLPKWIPFLSTTYLEHLQASRRGKQRSDRSNLLVPVEYAICKILYTCCKIRGEKVIVHFLNVETRYLELLLTSIEEAENAALGEASSSKWSWEQRYIVMLWLSHLHLAPFDLSTISSVDLDDVAVISVPGLVLPPNLPGITLRVIPLAIKYLASPGKERDGAKALLVRIAMRRDMQALGVLDSLVKWATTSLRPSQGSSPEPPYYYLGILAFLAGILRSSADTSDMDKFLTAIFHTVQAIPVDDSEVSKTIISFALARKMILKVTRSVTVSILRQDKQDMESTELTEAAIGYLLESISDSDTPVRLAASKSLSIITLKLDLDMASQVVEATLEALNRNVLWKRTPGAIPVRDLSAVDHLEWHGLMLTLSHLLYRRSPPAKLLSDIVHALLLGLSFEQRGMSGASVGSNVRDAACFGIWALARRYTTKELLDVPTQSVYAAKAHSTTISILQVLATELVTTASLDSAGNIRRGASAALQELIGRHPDTVEKGIWVVQTVDYHSVARRSRAIDEVALGAARLSAHYGEAIESGILGWRGIGDPDASARRVAGAAFGTLVAELSSSDSECLVNLDNSLQLISKRLGELQKRQVEERHGLLLCFAAVLRQFPLFAKRSKAGGKDISPTLISRIMSQVVAILTNYKETTYRKPELIVEAASQVVIAVVPVFLVANLGNGCVDDLVSLDQWQSLGLGSLVVANDEIPATRSEADLLLMILHEVISSWLTRNEPEIINPVARAALTLLIFLDCPQREATVNAWASAIRDKPTSRTSAKTDGYFHALVLAHSVIASDDAEIVRDAILNRWRVDSEVETRVMILQSLTQSRMLFQNPDAWFNLLTDGLNDYTTTARGDVGSHVRVETLRVISNLWQQDTEGSNNSIYSFLSNPSVAELFYSCLRLSGEKLDRVRTDAQKVISLVLMPIDAEKFRGLTFSSQAYFHMLLNLIHTDFLHPELSQLAKNDPGAWMAHLMAGFVTSADTGNEDLVIASRAALADFCETSSRNLHLVCNALTQVLRTRQGEDRVIVPTLEIIAFLFHVGLFQRTTTAENNSSSNNKEEEQQQQQRTIINLRSLCLQTQKAGYKTGNVRKIEACIKVYGGVASMGDDAVSGVQEAKRRLAALMFHPWPKVRVMVVDELWGLMKGDEGQALMGVDWGAADKAKIKAVVGELRLE